MQVVAFDRTHNKVKEVESLARELGVTIIQAHKNDAGRAVLEHRGEQQKQQQQEEEQGQEEEKGQQGQGALDESGEASGPGAGAGVDGAQGRHGTQEGRGGGAQPQLSEKARKREERRRAAMIARGIAPPEPREGGRRRSVQRDIAASTMFRSYFPRCHLACTVAHPCNTHQLLCVWHTSAGSPTPTQAHALFSTPQPNKLHTSPRGAAPSQPAPAPAPCSSLPTALTTCCWTRRAPHWG